jgi:S-adenosylmethionine:tRNA ribosyltransferase-isomerase
MRASGDTIEHIMRTYGELPLPPYIKYEKSKERDYQTSFAKKEGSVAAPTASLHFTSELMDKIENQKEYITLHVGLGTFRSVDTEDIRDYHIHSELIEIEIDLFDRIAMMKKSGKKILAVGTTVCRTLESLPYVWRVMDADMKKAFSQEAILYWDKVAKGLVEKAYIQSLTLSSEV